MWIRKSVISIKNDVHEDCKLQKIAKSSYKLPMLITYQSLHCLNMKSSQVIYKLSSNFLCYLLASESAEEISVSDEKVTV